SHLLLPSFPTRRSSDLCITRSNAVFRCSIWISFATRRACLAATAAVFCTANCSTGSLRARYCRVQSSVARKRAFFLRQSDGFTRSEEHTSELQSLAYLV